MGEAVPTLQAGHRHCQSCGAAKPYQKNICRHPDLNKVQAAVVDPERQLKFPSCIAATSLQADIVRVSESVQHTVLLDLTVPCEDLLEEAFEKNLSKYTGVVSNRPQAGWRARCPPVEATCRGSQRVL